MRKKIFGSAQSGPHPPQPMMREIIPERSPLFSQIEKFYERYPGYNPSSTNTKTDDRKGYESQGYRQ